MEPRLDVVDSRRWSTGLAGREEDAGAVNESRGLTGREGFGGAKSDSSEELGVGGACFEGGAERRLGFDIVLCKGGEGVVMMIRERLGDGSGPSPVSFSGFGGSGRFASIQSAACPISSDARC